ncbi:MAG: hypothetical protein ACM30E_01180 [Nitrososphaerales archaeon]
MKAWAALASLAVLLLVVSCVPLPQSTQTPAASSPAAPAAATVSATLPPSPALVEPTMGAWQTYKNGEIGFSISYPPGWNLAEMPRSENMEGIVLDGSEGHVEIKWGKGFGGACSAYSALHTSQGQIPVCHTVGADGIRHWEQIYKPLPAATFGARAYTTDAKQASADTVLTVLGTLAFDEPAGGATAAQGASARENEIVVDNADAGFLPKGNWYYLKGDPQYGQDCYAALPGLDATAQVRPDLPQAGSYEVFAMWCGGNFHDQARHGMIEVHRSAADSVPQMVGVDYQAEPGQWHSLGIYNLQPGAFLRVKSVLDGSALADAYRFVLAAGAGSEALPTPLPAGPVVSHNPPGPLQQVTLGDLAARLGITDVGFVAEPVMAVETTFDDCEAFPREGCSGTRHGYSVMVTYETISVTYRVSDDYKLVALQGIDSADPWMIGQEHPQRFFMQGYGGGMDFRVRYDPDSTWRLLRPGHDSAPDSDLMLSQEQVATLRELTPKYGTLYLKPAGGGTVVFYGMGPVVAPSDADRDALLALAAALTAAPRSTK